MITGNELRRKYIDFFISKGHKEIPSASLIPNNDPTVLFNTAGMQPLVPYLMGQKHPLGVRLVNIQKCLRTVDFDNIGDNTHHTFFQMLGNWSLGDYFKKESIAFSYEFLTNPKWLGINKEKLAFTVYQGDSKVPKDIDSAKFWEEQGVSKDRIAFLDAENNFWQAGETGPCGPDSEIFYWTGTNPTPKVFDPNDNKWVEIWNNVFMMYNRLPSGEIEELPKKNVDTGMGFERTLAIISGKESAYETDLFLPAIEQIAKLSGKKYEEYKKEFRVIADHLRASTFLIGDNCLPSNKDRGYILRRLIRRAIVFANKIGIKENFVESIAQINILIYKEWYPELELNKKVIIDELNKEELKFRNTLLQGLKEFEKIVAKWKEINGEDAFLLYQSYGFPIEMTIELAKEKNLQVDVNAFNEEYKKHQELSRTLSAGKFKSGLADNSELTTKYHTATHLLNEALRKIISKDIKQKGSNINAERLRFDFNFDRALTKEEIVLIENEINRVIVLGLDIKKEEMSLQKALDLGAQAEFGQKYPEIVSVYSIGDYSKEICMGPHVNNTKELGKFKIIKEESSAAGIRRIKAVLEN